MGLGRPSGYCSYRPRKVGKKYIRGLCFAFLLQRTLDAHTAFAWHSEAIGDAFLLACIRNPLCLAHHAFAKCRRWTMESAGPAAATGRSAILGESTRLFLLLKSLDSRSFRFVHRRGLERAVLIVASIVGRSDFVGSHHEPWAVCSAIL